MIPAPTMELTRLEEAPRMEDFFLGRESSLSLEVGAALGLLVSPPPAASVSRAAGRIVGAPPLLLVLVGDWCCW